MEKGFSLPFCSLFFIVATVAVSIMTGCAGIVPPSGGPRDTLAPKLVTAMPKDSATNALPEKINLLFDEFVEFNEINQRCIVSPIPKKSPFFDHKLNKVVIRLRDSLEPNTTYTIDLGQSIKDINEGNLLKDLTYTFSTGNKIASGCLSGKTVLAESGLVDSTLIAVLYKNLDDTAIYKSNPRYMARINGKGNFRFKNIERGWYNVFVLPNEYLKRYDDSTKLFGFLKNPLWIDDATAPVSFLVYQEEKRKTKKSPPKEKEQDTKKAKEKPPLKYEIGLEGNKQDLLEDLKIRFGNKLMKWDSSKLVLMDTDWVPIKGARFLLDTSRTIAQLAYPWKENMYFRLLLTAGAAEDSNGAKVLKNDTLRFSTKSEAEYGSVKLKFMGLDPSKNPKILLLSNESIEGTYPLKNGVFQRKLFRPKEYTVRLLYDLDNNGEWTPGSFKDCKQPEEVIDNKWKINVKANWDNESEFSL